MSPLEKCPGKSPPPLYLLTTWKIISQKTKPDIVAPPPWNAAPQKIASRNLPSKLPMVKFLPENNPYRIYRYFIDNGK